MSYFLNFTARGEVADILLVGGEEPRLLVDLSTEPLHDRQGLLCHHTPRASFTITDPELMRRFLAEVKPGDLAEATGEFRQGDYLPHRGTQIDTVFEITSYRRIAGAVSPSRHPAPATQDPHVAPRAGTAALLH